MRMGDEEKPTKCICMLIIAYKAEHMTARSTGLRINDTFIKKIKIAHLIDEWQIQSSRHDKFVPRPAMPPNEINRLTRKKNSPYGCLNMQEPVSSKLLLYELLPQKCFHNGHFKFTLLESPTFQNISNSTSHQTV